MTRRKNKSSQLSKAANNVLQWAARAKKPRRTSECYLCGISLYGANTSSGDHTPPRCVFSDPPPPNLITVPCCKLCNTNNSENDFYFSILMSTGFNRSRSGEMAWDRIKMVNEKDKKYWSKAFKAKLKDIETSMSQVLVDGRTLTHITYDKDIVDRQFIRITKGLIIYFNLDIDARSCVDWKVEHISQMAVIDALYILDNGLTEGIIHEGRGEDFQVWYASDKRRGWFVYLFHESMMFHVTFTPVERCYTGS